MARRHHRAGGALTGALLAGLLAACTSSSAQEPAPVVSSAPTSRASAPGPAAAAAAQAVPVRDATGPATAVVRPPERLEIPSLDIDMAVLPVGVADDGTMSIPPKATDVGWYRFGSAPDDAGSTVLAAHVDSWVSGIGPFARLRHVRDGARVVVTTSDGVAHRYVVTSIEKIPKSEAPVGDWFDRTGRSRLVLVTCGGAWQPKIRHYAENVVVTADPTGG
ncbi:MAG: class F sortase [Brevundimonas sp.]